MKRARTLLRILHSRGPTRRAGMRPVAIQPRTVRGCTPSTRATVETDSNRLSAASSRASPAFDGSGFCPAGGSGCWPAGEAAGLAADGSGEEGGCGRRADGRFREVDVEEGRVRRDIERLLWQSLLSRSTNRSVDNDQS